ncbi:HNH endonuclease signature motif containing protein [Cryobacterium tepidiphilum]|uniref:HNH endonuclease n=1 Tax=Cryobacterium tepidiphilum TaxID=2486026 RepID=A0A3M8LNY7_9MICO|nr:HNH endonuclease signature motif containing protein [Cryobacterium tepidiphilum]RNE67055.1 HNH endonuclease [Cryobacterium tepidiphilum]
MGEVVEIPVDPDPNALDRLTPELLEQWAAEWADDRCAEALAADVGVVDECLVVPAPTLLSHAIEDAATALVAANQAMAMHVGALAKVLDVARRNPHLYLTEDGLAERDALELAQRAAALDVALHLKLTPDVVRNRAHEGRVLAESLPLLWGRFQAGVIGYAEARAAVELLPADIDPDGVAHYDRELAEKAGQVTPGAFRQKARALRRRLLAEPALRHAQAFLDRRVVIEPADDGMAWIHALVSAPDAVRIKARLGATAKREAKKQAKAAATAGGGRHSRDQIRADLLVGWLAGDGTPTAAKVRPLLFVPLLGLIGEGDGQPSVLQGYGPIDPASAAQLFIDAPAFRRVGTDPFTGEILDFDRRRYRPTKAQREMLAVKFGTCGRENCDRLAVTADVDHLKEWARDHGLTNIDNLVPLCPPDHRLKTLTKFRYERDLDGTITVTTPTGYIGRNVPPNPLPVEPPPF